MLPCSRWFPVLHVRVLFQFTVLVYNPLGRETNHWVRVPVVAGNYKVTDSKQQAVASQVVPLSDATKNVPAHNGSTATQEVVFRATAPPLGFNTYFVQQQKMVQKKGTVHPLLSRPP